MMIIAPTKNWQANGNQYVDSICICGSCEGYMRAL